MSHGYSFIVDMSLSPLSVLCGTDSGKMGTVAYHGSPCCIMVRGYAAVPFFPNEGCNLFPDARHERQDVSVEKGGVPFPSTLFTRVVPLWSVHAGAHKPSQGN